MPRYIALIHKESDGCYGVSFPDIPGVITGGDTVDEALEQAGDVLQFAAEDWINPDGTTGFKAPSTIDELRSKPEFLEDEKNAVVAFVDYPAGDDAVE
jgi:predicted RNase H-like HicB family nuclease